jgi:hypothetical protein
MNKVDFWKEFSTPLGLIIVFVIAFWAVFGVTKNFAKPPVIELISGNEIVTDAPEVPITGIIRNTSRLKVSDKEVPVSADGEFSVVVPVNVGKNDIKLVAGDRSITSATVVITREDSEKSIISASTSDNLTPSGPVETLWGSLGLSMILVSLIVFRRSISENSLQKA